MNLCARYRDAFPLTISCAWLFADEQFIRRCSIERAVAKGQPNSPLPPDTLSGVEMTETFGAAGTPKRLTLQGEAEVRFMAAGAASREVAWAESSKVARDASCNAARDTSRR